MLYLKANCLCKHFLWTSLWPLKNKVLKQTSIVLCRRFINDSRLTQIWPHCPRSKTTIVLYLTSCQCKKIAEGCYEVSLVAHVFIKGKAITLWTDYARNNSEPLEIPHHQINSKKTATNRKANSFRVSILSGRERDGATFSLCSYWPCPDIFEPVPALWLHFHALPRWPVGLGGPALSTETEASLAPKWPYLNKREREMRSYGMSETF